jgi:hypothetical protein
VTAADTDLFRLGRHGVTVVAMLLLVVLPGCGLTGDFGRTRSSLRTDDAHAWLGPAAYQPAVQPPWKHQLTEEERQLRDYAFPLIDPPYKRNEWLGVLRNAGLTSRPWPYPDRAAYASRLFQTAYRSQDARYNRLVEDIRNDVTRLDPFYRTAQTVTDRDQRRGRSLAYVSELSREEHQNTVTRMRENEAIIRWVGESVRERIASYRIALERLVIAAPSPMAVEAERALTLLQQRASAYGA